jgi:Fur family transcriptional regulator, ferric uptake regulator
MEAADQIRASGYRMTRQRQLVWDVLRAADRHLSADELLDAIRDHDPDLNLSSVYRTLALLVELGLAQEVRLGDAVSYWEPAHSDDEYHLVCDSCGNVLHHPSELVDQIRDHLWGHGFEASEVKLVVHGQCRDCRDRQVESH